MMHSLKYLLFFLMIFAIGGSMYIATLNGNYAIKEQKLVKIPLEVVFDEVKDFNNWKHWETWNDKEMKSSIEITNLKKEESQTLLWLTDKDTIAIKTISTELNEKIVQELDFGMSTKTSLNWSFYATPDGAEILVDIFGESSFKEKIMMLFKGKVEDKIRPIVEKSLIKLERYLEKKIDEHSYTIKGVVEHGGGFYVYKSSSSKILKIQEKSEPIFKEMASFLERNSLIASAHKFVIIHTVNQSDQSVVMSSCIPIQEKINTEEDFFIGYLEPKKMYKLVLKGHYKYTQKALDIAYEAIKENRIELLENGEPIQVFKVTKSTTPNPANWETEIYIPVK